MNESNLAKSDNGIRSAIGRTVRPKLLVSVRDVSEAAAALAGGAEWIDLKEPSTGPLGTVDGETAQEVVEYVAGRCRISAALGELNAWTSPSAQRLLDVPGIELVKLGLAGCADADGWTNDWLAAERAIRQVGKSLVAVAYADCQRARSPAPEQIVALAKQTACQYLLIDTFDKTSAGTLGCLGPARLSSLLRLAQRESFHTVVAGGITPAEFTQLPTTSIDMVAVRGGVCPGDRRGQVDRRLVEEFRHALAARWPTRSHAKAKPS